jgi:phosphoadenosine phosphosulfate reductase
VPSRPQLPELDYEAMEAEEILGTMLDAFPGRVSLACSFQKEESVLLEMLFAIEPKARVFALDTHLLFPETYDVWREVERRYSTHVEVYEGPSLAEQAAVHGDALWERDPTLCCAIRKVAPLARALGDLDAWITGLRRDQSAARANAPKVGWDDQHELWKANPLADWSEERCRAYIDERDLPLNKLHDRGYASIGCTHCTQPGTGREGRWTGFEKTECGLHARLAGVAAETPNGEDAI